METLRLASWLDKTAMVICDVREEDSHELVTVAPRSILRTQIERAKSLKYSLMAGSELEYYIFQDSYQSAAEKRYTELKPMGWYIEDYHAKCRVVGKDRVECIVKISLPAKYIEYEK
jgi:glutamine synthetase